jgi:diguanylate cyclase (GGDEF)-like protein
VQERTENKRFLEDQRHSVVEQLSTIRAQLEGELNAELLLTHSIITEIVIHADIRKEKFFEIAQHLMEESKHIENIGLARGTVLTYVYPVQGNEAAIGMDYRKNTRQWPAVKQAVDERKTVITGPSDLVQGGSGLISRTPIFVHRPDSVAKEYFGLLSVVIKVPSLLRAAGVSQTNSSLALSLRGKDGLGAQGEVFYGHKNIFMQEPVLLEVVLPGGTWQMAAVPVHGWEKRSPNIPVYRTGTSAIALLLLSLLFLQKHEIKIRKKAETERNRLIQELEVKNKALLEQALTDPLTGLYNRRAIMSTLQTEINRNNRFNHTSSLLIADIDHFKQVNDVYGHMVGDTVLKMITSCVGNNMRRTDSFARWGGEEFLVFAPETSLRKGGIFAEKIRCHVEEIVYPEGMTITLSIGVAEFRPDEELDLWIQRADKALYKAKLSGRNRVETDGATLLNSERAPTRQDREHTENFHNSGVSDPLRKINNRYAVLPVLENEINRNNRFGHVSSLLLAEIDPHRETDDHDDVVSYELTMQAICSALAGQIRSTDTFARWEKKKLLLLAPETSLEHADFFAEKFKKCIEHVEHAEEIKINFSIGIAEFKPDEELDSWIRRADHALDKAKSYERNYVCKDFRTSGKNGLSPSP